MVEGLRVAVKALKDLWGEMFNLVSMNLFTLLCLAAVIPGPPAVVALYAVCNRIANDYAISWEHYFAAFRAHFAKAWLYALAALVFTALLLLNLWWYGAAFAGATWASWVQGAWLAALLLWLAANFYVVPFYFEQQDRRWRVALRNAILIVGAHPLFTLVILVIVGLLMALSLLITPLFILLGLAIWALFGSEAVVNRVNVYRQRMQAKASEM
jgi:uncharacterized membrane protein YesL